MEKSILLLALVALAGCASPNGYEGKESRERNSFAAKYYSGENLIASEEVDSISIHYAWDKFHGINSPNFRAIWEGRIDGGESGRYATMSFHQSWANKLIYLDDKEVSGWGSAEKRLTEFIKPGLHNLRVEYKNNWHTTNFNLSFDNYPTLDKALLRNEFKKDINPSTKVVYIGAYESADIYNRATVSIPKSKDPLVIFLYSYSGINWIIDNPHKTNISHIIINDTNGSSIENAQKNTQTYFLSGLKGSHENFGATANEIADITGLRISYTFGKYGLSQVSIPEPL